MRTKMKTKESANSHVNYKDWLNGYVIVIFFDLDSLFWTRGLVSFSSCSKMVWLSSIKIFTERMSLREQRMFNWSVNILSIVIVPVFFSNELKNFVGIVSERNRTDGTQMKAEDVAHYTTETIPFISHLHLHFFSSLLSHFFQFHFILFFMIHSWFKKKK